MGTVKHLTSSKKTSHPSLTLIPNPKQQLLKLRLPNSVKPLKVYSLKATNRYFKLSLCWQSLHHFRHTLTAVADSCMQRSTVMNISTFCIPVPPAVQLGTELQSTPAPCLPSPMAGCFTCLTSVTQEILVLNILDLQYYKVKQKQQNDSGKEFSPSLHSTVDSIIFMKAVSLFGCSKRWKGAEQLEMPFSLHLHVPAICKTPHELYFHKVKWRNQTNECCCCEWRLILCCKQILILNCLLQLDPFWWKKRERGGNKIVNSTSQSDFFNGFFPLPKIKPIPYSDVLMKIALDRQEASITPQGSGNR